MNKFVVFDLFFRDLSGTLDLNEISVTLYSYESELLLLCKKLGRQALTRLTAQIEIVIELNILVKVHAQKSFGDFLPPFI